MTIEDEDMSMQVEVLAQMLRADARESEAYFESLATKLTGALPDRTTVERAGGLFTRKKKVESIRVEFTTTHFIIAREKHGPVAHKAKIVRGVQLSKKELSLDQWTLEMAEEIRALAANNAGMKAALEKFIIGE